MPSSAMPGVPEVCNHRKPAAVSMASLYLPICFAAPTSCLVRHSGTLFRALKPSGILVASSSTILRLSALQMI